MRIHSCNTRRAESLFVVPDDYIRGRRGVRRGTGVQFVDDSMEIGELTLEDYYLFLKKFPRFTLMLERFVDGCELRGKF